MPTAADTLDFRRHVHDLCETWQGRCLRETCEVVRSGTVAPRGGYKLGAVLLSMLAHNFDDALPVLLKAVFPDFYTIGVPFICSTAKIDKASRIVADTVWYDNAPVRKDFVVFWSLAEFEGAFRRLADKLKLSDADRLQLFIVAKNWVVADRRLDPNMDPADPDARRLTVH